MRPQCRATTSARPRIGMNMKDAARVRERQHDPRGVLDLRLAPRVLALEARFAPMRMMTSPGAMPAGQAGPLCSTATTNAPSPWGGVADGLHVVRF